MAQIFKIGMIWLQKDRKYLMEELDGTAIQEFWNCKKVQKRFENISKETPQLYKLTIEHLGEYHVKTTKNMGRR